MTRPEPDARDAVRVPLWWRHRGIAAIAAAGIRHRGHPPIV